eukprot:TRINITY_DN320_c0_g1_i2.p1 TRINITY_DN320_c0_g1~~TRINITY_DN320_c0_g1_i2.p1  ORF type:complete len:207 (-),score=63.13 TRINITY_DN320_c0_g1_i2:73-693(-)
MLTDEDLKLQCEEILEEADKRIAQYHDELKADGKAPETDPKKLEIQLRRTVSKLFAEVEHHKKHLEGVRQREERRKHEKDTQFMEEINRKREENERWEAGQDIRVANWRDFQTKNAETEDIDTNQTKKVKKIVVNLGLTPEIKKAVIPPPPPDDNKKPPPPPPSSSPSESRSRSYRRKRYRSRSPDRYRSTRRSSRYDSSKRRRYR